MKLDETDLSASFNSNPVSTKNDAQKVWLAQGEFESCMLEVRAQSLALFYRLRDKYQRLRPVPHKQTD
jgi:hypothetical protein